MTPTFTLPSQFPCHECCIASQPSSSLLQVCLVACRKHKASVHAAVLGRGSRSATGCVILGHLHHQSTIVHDCPRICLRTCQETPSPDANDFISIHRLTTTSSGPYMTLNQASSLPVKRTLSLEQKTTLTRTSPSHHHTVHRPQEVLLGPDSLHVSPKVH